MARGAGGGARAGSRLHVREMNQRVGEVPPMLGTSWRPVVAPNGRTGSRDCNITASWPDSLASAGAGQEPQSRWQRLRQRFHHAVVPWLRRLRRNPDLADRLTGHLLRDIGLEGEGDPSAHSVSFRLPREL